PATLALYTLSLHDALPIFLELDRRARDPARSRHDLVRDLDALRDLGLHVVLGGDARRRDDAQRAFRLERAQRDVDVERAVDGAQDRKSTRLNSSHVKNSYA